MENPGRAKIKKEDDARKWQPLSNSEDYKLEEDGGTLSSERRRRRRRLGAEETKEQSSETATAKPIRERVRDPEKSPLQIQITPLDPTPTEPDSAPAAQEDSILDHSITLDIHDGSKVDFLVVCKQLLVPVSHQASKPDH